MLRPTEFPLASASDAQRAIDVLRSRFRIAGTNDARARTRYLDTFDARLGKRGVQLQFTDGEPGRLELLESGGVVLRAPRGTAPDFAWDIENERLRERIEPLVDVRRLLPLVELEQRVHDYSILDSEEKTIVRVQVVEGTAREPGGAARRRLPPVLRLTPVRGYERDFKSAARALEREASLASNGADELSRALAAVGRDVVAASKKPSVRLSPGTHACEALREVHRSLFETVIGNEHGTRENLDSEFLHDFRVAVRRIRSALSQVRGVFPEETVTHFAAEFAWLGSVTGPARDTDVFLLKMPEYRKSLPPEAADRLGPLGEFLVRRQDACYAALRAELASDRYAALKADWTGFLAGPMARDASAPLAEVPVLQVASERIKAVADKVLRRGRKISDSTPTAKVHQLRIQCKKLRYLLDMFASLYEHDDSRGVIKRLKRLQDCLGDFNDCDVQIEALSGFAAAMTNEGAVPVETFLAMGRLEEQLAIRQRAERELFAERFRTFDDDETRGRLERITSGEGAGR